MKKLYYEDSYIQSFSTKLLKQQEDENGHTYVVLGETAFYPTGGGQPFDTGQIDGVDVINVEEVDNEIRHYINRPLEGKAEVSGVINWERRFDHMQQHAGQHILSAAFAELFDMETIGFHLGNETLTIDLNVEELTEEVVREAEKLANQIILENRPIETKWITLEEVTQYPLRKKPTVTEDIRLVIIPEFDYNGCGGTHPSSTGQVSSIKILDWERQKKKVRLGFICGNRVLKHFYQKHQVLSKLTQQLNAPEQDMELAVGRLLDKNKELEKLLEESTDRLLHLETDLLLNQSSIINQHQIVGQVYEGRTIQQLQKQARILVSKKEELNVFLISENENQIQIVCSRGKEAAVNMKALVANILPLINGKGGGNETQAQGGGEKILSGEEIVQRIVNSLN
ncbi:DHHA1 domain-containing protein [Bacillus sp. 31A1R]|uniref:DHHA1 domain-containing protein n=1 Tax=Robertmurraya mangrovi TaxID=3098077 RepID=A0ABU5IWQ6_9BACI|nr:DHHA1 domain-containing protein [Bacillus sp. 31A1R]MDZ5471566.1 DHHA1 domain-containing protein [Bacillus sp. 31A1R]